MLEFLRMKIGLVQNFSNQYGTALLIPEGLLGQKPKLQFDAARVTDFELSENSTIVGCSRAILVIARMIQFHGIVLGRLTLC